MAPRAGLGPRREARTRIRRALANPRLVGAVLGGVVLVLLLGWTFDVLNDAFGNNRNPFVKGLLMGAGFASVGWMVWTLVLWSDAHSWMVGAEAEEWTGRELARLGPEWAVEHHVPFTGRRRGKRWVNDIDHIAVGPPGVLVIDTKWTSDEWDLSHPEQHERLRQHVAKAMAKAELITPILRQAVPDAPVLAVVVCWGPNLRVAGEPVTKVNDVRIVAGHRANEWRSLLTATRLETDQVARLREVVRRRVAEYEHIYAKETGASVRGRALVARARRFSIATAAAVSLSTALLLASITSAPIDRLVARALAFAGGFGGALFVFTPFVLGLVAGVQVWLSHHAVRDWDTSQQHAPAVRRSGLTAGAALGAWLALLLSLPFITR